MDGSSLRVGAALSNSLLPAPVLYSRLVIIKGFTEPEPFLGAVRRQMEALQIEAEPGIPHVRSKHSVEGRCHLGSSVPLRRTIEVHGKKIVGFAVRVDGLTAEESLRLQEVGIGGRRFLGCGLFIPFRPN
jgi:CRISPR-associated endonuclease/helicase Cas3